VAETPESHFIDSALSPAVATLWLQLRYLPTSVSK
jgi:hypothetical protein